jgi:hypothetical protein
MRVWQQLYVVILNNPVLGALTMSCIIIHIATKSSETEHQHVAYITKHTESCL